MLELSRTKWTKAAATQKFSRLGSLQAGVRRDKHLRGSMWCRARVVGGHATIGRLSNNVFRRFKQFGKSLKKVTERSRDSGWGHATVGRLSNNVFWRFKQLENILKKVAERSRDSGRRSRDRRPTVKQRFWRFQEILENFEKSRWTVTRQWLRSRDRRPTVKQRFLDVSSN